MVGSKKGVARKIKDAAPSCYSVHCILHWEALAARIYCQMCGKNYFDEMISDVVEIVNNVHARAKKSRKFEQLCKEVDAEFSKLLLQAEVVLWQSVEQIFNRFLS